MVKITASICMFYRNVNKLIDNYYDVVYNYIRETEHKGDIVWE